MKNLFSLKERITALLCVLLLAFVFTGCQDPNNAVIPAAEDEVPVEFSPLPEALKGTWTSTYYEVFEITDTTFSNGAYSYAGDSVVVVKTDETSGIIYMKYTRALETTTEDKSADSSWATWDNGQTYTRYSETAPDVGKWYAVAYKNLSTNSVEFSGAYKADGKTSTDTDVEAAKEFTVANGYFASYSECTK